MADQTEGADPLNLPKSSGPIGRIWTLQEAAEYLKMTPRALALIAKRVGACSVRSRSILFSDEDIKIVWEEIRAEPKEPRRRTVSSPMSSFQLYKNLAALTAKKSRRKPPRP